jgi:hypothetical protein
LIRIGTILIAVSGIAMIWYSVSQGSNWYLMSQRIWFKEFLIVLIVLNAFLLSKRWTPFWLGSAVSFTSWWMATILGLWRDIPYNFLELSIAYVVLVLLVAEILTNIKKSFTK